MAVHHRVTPSIKFASTNVLLNQARGQYWGILARGHGSTDQANSKTTEVRSLVRLELAGLVSSL